MVGFVAWHERCVTAKAMLGLVPNIRYRRDPINIWKQEQRSASTGSVFLVA